MHSVDGILQVIEDLIAEGKNIEKARQNMLKTTRSPLLKDERDRVYDAQIAANNEAKIRYLGELARFPPQHHERHRALLQEFFRGGTFEQSVFIMTKFPDEKNPGPRDLKLEAVIREVREAVTACGYVPRVASDVRYHPGLWDNVELYLLGCSRGIAIVENKYLPELNPNVAMEWGWMRGMGRSVLYLIESSFDQQRADWGGLIEDRFDWDDPRPAVRKAVHDWLRCGKPH